MSALRNQNWHICQNPNLFSPENTYKVPFTNASCVVDNDIILDNISDDINITVQY